MAFQFVHVDTYSIKNGGLGVALEAGRTPSHCRHVDDPQPPLLLAGTDPQEAWKEILRRHGASTSKVTVKGVERSRKLRVDEQVMLAAVASYPTPTTELVPGDPDLADWVSRTLAFLEAEHGPALSAVLHLDESHPHIHYLASPDLESGARMPDIHRGLGAKRAAGGNRGKKGVIDQAYKDAMRDYQDQYQEHVGRWHGQARLGPQVQRLTRSEWIARQAEALRAATLLAAGKDIQRRLTLLEKREDKLKGHVHLLKAKAAEIAGREARLESLGGRALTALTFGLSDRRARRMVAAAQAEQDAIEKAKDTQVQKAQASEARLASRLRGDQERARGLEMRLLEAESALEDGKGQSHLAAALKRRLDAAAKALEKGDLPLARKLLDTSAVTSRSAPDLER